jgi:DNA-binding NarL/FixJ family response regulator
MHSRYVKKETTSLWSSPGVDGFLFQPFTKEEMLAAVLTLKAGKAQIKPQITSQQNSS